jgi:hypothetical protein
MRKKIDLAADMVREMQNRGLGVDIPDDIQSMSLTPKEEKAKLEKLGWYDGHDETKDVGDEEGLYL